MVLTLCVRALFIFLSFSIAIKAFLAECLALRFSCITSDDGFMESAGRSSESTAGSFGFLPRTNWNGENPATF